MRSVAKRALQPVGGRLREAFPSARQRRCIGLKPATYPAYDRWAVDYDYLARLTEEERVWLAAFTEEHYRGWSLKKETQVNPPEALRKASTDHSQRRRTRNPNIQTDPTQGELEAASYGLQEHELRGRNLMEDQVVRWLDRPRRVK